MSDWKPFMRGFNQGPSLAELVMWGVSRRDARHEKIAEDEAQATADEEAKEKEAGIVDALVAMFLPEPTGFEQGAQLGTTYPDLGLSVAPGMKPPRQEQQQAPPGGWFPGQEPSRPRGEDIYAEGAPTYAEGEGMPLPSLLAITDAMESGDLAPGMGISMMNMAKSMGIPLYEQAPEEVPVEFDQQSFDLVATMFANSFPHIPTKEDFPEEFHDEVDMVGRMPMQTIMDLYKKPEEDEGERFLGMFSGNQFLVESGEGMEVRQGPPPIQRPEEWRVAGNMMYLPSQGPESATPIGGTEDEDEYENVEDISPDLYNEILSDLGYVPPVPDNSATPYTDEGEPAVMPRNMSWTQLNAAVLREANERSGATTVDIEPPPATEGTAEDELSEAATSAFNDVYGKYLGGATPASLVGYLDGLVNAGLLTSADSERVMAELVRAIQ